MHLKGYGWIRAFKTVAKDGSFEYWVTSKLDMTLEEYAFCALDAWQIEAHHRGLKQNTGIERGQFRLLNAQKNHVSLDIRAFVRLEVYRLKTHISRFEAKQVMIRQSIRAYLKYLSHILLPTA